MLSDEVIDKVVERLVNRIEQANTYVLKEIGRSIKKLGTINPTKANQLVQMMKYGGDYEKIIKEVAKLTNKNVNEIEEIFEEIAKNDYRFAKKFYKYRNIGYLPYDENKVLKEQVKALANIAKQDYINLTNTTSMGFGIKDSKGKFHFKSTKQEYYDILDEAVISVAEGKETFNSAMYRKLKEIGSSGLKVMYSDTHLIRRLDTALRMNLKSALRNLHNEMQKEIGKQIGADGVEISAHENPAEDHQEAQGRQFTNEEYEKLQTTGEAITYDNRKINMHRGSHFRPISEWNCYHYTFATVLGVDKPQHSDKQLQEIIERNNKGFEYKGKHYTMYEGTQLQRQIETDIRRQKDIQIGAVAGGNEQLILESQNNIRKLTKEYNELNKTSGLRPKVDRLKVEGYKRQDTSKYNLPKKLKTDNIIVNDGIEVENVTVIAGYGTRNKIKTIDKLIKDFPELPLKWQKVVGTPKGQTEYQIHWYQNGDLQLYHKKKKIKGDQEDES